PSALISSLSGSGGIVTATTTAPHGFLTGQTVLVAGANSAAFNGTFTIASTTSNTFTYADPTTATASATMFANGVVISNLTGTAGTVTVNTAFTHGLTSGSSVIITGVNP